MCEPATLTTIAIVASVGATAAQAYGQYQAGEYQKKVADQNARIAEDEAALALQRGAIAKGVERMKGAQEIGAARAAQGTSGIDMTSGSALDVISDAAMLNELDAQTIGNNAAREAWGYQVEATNARAAGRLAQTQARFAAASTLIGGAAQAASMGANYKLRAGGGTSAGSLT
jgi:hypothetical protein